jgi:hypothetical protein
MVVALLVAAVMLGAGQSYVWCVPMQRAMPRCCLEAARDRLVSAPVRREHIEALRFERRALARLPEARGSAPVEIGPATVCTRSPTPAPHARTGCFRFAHAELAAPRPLPFAVGPPTARQRCAVLQSIRS